MKTRIFNHSILTLALGCLLCSAPGLRSQDNPQTPPAQPPGKVDPNALAGPRTYSGDGYDFAVYQPQINSWTGIQLAGRFGTAPRK